MIKNVEKREAHEKAKEILKKVKAKPTKVVVLPKGMMSDFKPKNKKL
jgi:hypothetical protein